MIFEQLLPGMPIYGADTGDWQFVLVETGGFWTFSYSASGPKLKASPSKTISERYALRADAEAAAEAKLAELMNRGQVQ